MYALDPAKLAPTLEEYLKLVHPEDREFMAGTIEKMVTEGLGCDVKKRIVRPDGEVRYIRCVGVPVLDNGILKCINGTAMDVTEQEHLTQELQRREAYLAEAQRLSQTGSFGWSVASGEIYWSDETFRIFEFDPTTKPTLELILERVHPDDRALVQQIIDRASDHGTDFDTEYRLLMPDGAVKNLHVVAHVLQDSSDHLDFVGAVTDVTATKLAEEKIRQNEKELRTIIETIPAFVETSLPDGSCDFVSQSWLNYLGLSKAEWLDWGWMATVHPDDIDKSAAKWRVALATGEPLEQEARCRMPNGEYRWFLGRNVPLRDEKGNITKWYGTLVDLEDRKRAEEELRKSEEQWRHVFENNPTMYFMVDAAGAVIAVNPFGAEQLGYRTDE